TIYRATLHAAATTHTYALSLHDALPILVVPELVGKFDGLAVRVPTINVSLVDLSFIAGRNTSIDEVNDIIRKACASGPMAEVLADRKSTRLNSSHVKISYAVFCLKKKNK